MDSSYLSNGWFNSKDRDSKGTLPAELSSALVLQPMDPKGRNLSLVMPSLSDLSDVCESTVLRNRDEIRALKDTSVW